MTKLIWQMILMFLVIAGHCFAETNESPRFEDYPIDKVYQGKPKHVNLQSHPQANKWRTVLRGGAKEGPNFAGHYTIVQWGCGSSCHRFAIIDAETGKVYFPKNISCVSCGWWWEKDCGLQFIKNSNLLVISGSTCEIGEHGTFYYIWKENDLKFLKFDIEKQ
jgi:hypothetical protein